MKVLEAYTYVKKLKDLSGKDIKDVESVVGNIDNLGQIAENVSEEDVNKVLTMLNLEDDIKGIVNDAIGSIFSSMRDDLNKDGSADVSEVGGDYEQG